MKNKPKKIYLQIDWDGEIPEDFNGLTETEITWSLNKVFTNDLEYIDKQIADELANKLLKIINNSENLTLSSKMYYSRFIKKYYEI